jgi:Kef-type K+ transport system membrane component KefB
VVLPIGARLEVGDAAATGVVTAGQPGQPGLAADALMGRVLLAVAAVVVLARLAGSLFERIGQPPVIGEIAVGVALGPSLAGALLPDAAAFLFHDDVIGVLEVMAQFGLIFFMFLLGLHLDLPAVRRSGATALFVSHVSIVVPFTLGVLAALVLHPTVGVGTFAPFALFIGAAMAITAFPVLARILTDTGLERTWLGNMALTCAAVDDVTAWCVLSVVVAIARAGGPGDAVVTVVLSLGFAVVMLGVVRPLLARLASPSRPSRRRGPELQAGLIAGVLLAAWTTQQIGIHAIFGAFLAGMVVPRSDGYGERVTARLEDVTRVFLLPTFFVVVGLSTRLDLLGSPEMWGITALLVVVAVVGKLGAATLAARSCRIPWRDAAALGVLMNARGLTEIVILTIGRRLGVISDEIFTAMVVMAVVTTLMTTPLLLRLKPRTATLGGPPADAPDPPGHREPGAAITPGSEPVAVGAGSGRRPALP